MSLALLQSLPARSVEKHRRIAAFAAAAATLGIIVPLVLGRSFGSAAPAAPQHHQAPRHKQPYAAEKYLQGARDVETPYGSLRVYEWGLAPSKRRVLFIPGISNPCLSLAEIAHALADHGCRVMLIDHYGRGFSDAPDTEQVRYDGRLYASEIFSAVTSSPISWIQPDEPERKGFSIVGYSLGGALAAHFASHYPMLVEDLVLIGPGGLLRPENISLRSKVLYSRGWMPERLLQWLVGRRMTASSSPAPGQKSPQSDASLDPATLVPTSDSDESQKFHASTSRWSSISKDCDEACARQIHEHAGFIPAFMSSMRFAPIQFQQHRWSLIGQRLHAQRGAEKEMGSLPSTSQGETMQRGLRSGKVHLVLGETDSIIKVKEIVPDATAALQGSSNLHVSVIKGVGHDVAYVRGQEVAGRILEVWRERGL